MVIDEAKLDDLAALLVLQEAALPRVRSFDLAAAIGSVGSSVVVARDGGVLVGYLVSELHPASHDDVSYVAIKAVYVNTEDRRRGFASEMLCSLMNSMLERGYSEIRVQNSALNGPAQDLFQFLDFNISEVVWRYFLQPGTDRYTINEQEPWYSVRCHFLWSKGEWAPEQAFEERVTLWRAESGEEAVGLAEDEAKRYANAAAGDITYLGACSAYHLSDTGFAVVGKEVFSQLRYSDLQPSAYLDRYFFTGEENTPELTPTGCLQTRR